jgi:transcriptional regulator with XRE-family HTH domain
MPEQAKHPLSRYRKKNNLTYEKLAARIGGVSTETIRSWCNGRRRMKRRTRERIATAIGLDTLEKYYSEQPR